MELCKIDADDMGKYLTSIGFNAEKLRNQFEAMVDAVNANNKESLRASGTDEEFTQLTQEIEDVIEDMESVHATVQEARQLKDKKKSEDAEKALEMRQDATVPLGKKIARSSKAARVG